MKIPYINLKLQWDKEKRHLGKIINKVLSKGNYVVVHEREHNPFKNIQEEVID